MISIEIISKGEEYLYQVLNSITDQTIKDYEVIIADSSGNLDLNNYKQYNFKIINLPLNTPALKARYEAHKFSTGEYSLILDSTRPLTNNALELLLKNYNVYDMVIIREGSIGKGFWVNQAKLLKEISENQVYRLKNENLAFLLPRFYNSKILTQGFEYLKQETGQLFDKIGYGEHHLIFESCRKFSNNIGITSEILLNHFEDDSLFYIIKKYYYYGRSQKILNNVVNSDAKKINSHIRKNVSLIKRIKVLPITLARGIPFAIGYILG